MLDSNVSSRIIVVKQTTVLGLEQLAYLILLLFHAYRWVLIKICSK